MSSRIRKLMAGAGLLAFVVGCTPERDPATLFAPDAVGTLVVDAALIVDQPLPSLRLTRTQAPDAPYDPAEAYVGDATVLVRVYTSAGFFSDYPYRARPGNLDYAPVTVSPPVVLPRTRYGLVVTTPGGETVAAETTTPARFSIDAWALMTTDGQTEVRQLRTFAELGQDVYDHPDNLLVYPEGQLDARFSGDGAAAYGAAGFQLAIFSLDADAGFVIDPPFFEEEDFLDLPRSGSSPAFDGEDGFIRLPWFAVYYDGRHLYKAFAVDRNWFDLVRTQPEGGGGFGFGGNFGEGVDPPLFHVQGGIGLFGSASVDSTGFRINPVE